MARWWWCVQWRPLVKCYRATLADRIPANAERLMTDDQNADYLTVAHYTEALQRYVSNGGKYAGFCLGAFFARGKNSNETFFGLLPNGSYVSSERFEKGAQVSGDEDTTIQVDWKFHTGPKRGEEIAGRWA